MPLGFAKSLLSRYEAPAGGGGGAAYYWTDEADASSGNGAGYILNKGSQSGFAASADISAVVWFRCPNGSHGGLVWNGMTSTGSPGQWYALGVYGSRIQLHVFQPGNRMTALFAGPITGSTREDVFDGAWHCAMLYHKGDATNPSSIENDFMAVFDDRVATTSTATTGTAQVTDYSVYNNASLETMDNLTALTFSFRDLSTTTPTAYNANGETGSTFDIGPCWIYDKKIDFTSSTVRGYYYDSTATDGYVNGGTDGTAGGAEQPAIYMYHDGTDWKNGGTKFESTATKVTEGSGDVVISNTDGPGTGETT
jgi:hypothetical protein